MAATRQPFWRKNFEDSCWWWNNWNRKISWMRNEEQLELAKDENFIDIIRLLKACAAQKDLDKGSKLHAYIQKHSYSEKEDIGSSLVNMYAKCGALAKAQQVLNELSVRNVVTWNALIAGYVQQGRGDEALKCLDNMQHEGHSPDVFTLNFVLKACGNLRASAKGKELHDKIVSSGMLQKDVVLGNALVDMYVKCGALAKAQRVLEELSIRNVVTWSTLIAGYAKQGQGEEALKCFDSMQCEGHSPNAVTFVCVLKACGSIGAVARGKEIHDKIVRLGMLDKDIVLGGALVDMYTNCGALHKAQKVLEELPVRNAFIWNTLIVGYAQQGRGEEALKCYDNMLHEGHSPNVVTFICVLKACGSIRAVAKGEQICDKIVSLGMLEKDIVLGNALVDMYVKCGALAKAYQVLKELSIRDVVTWNALLAGYAQQGQGEEALRCFNKMQFEGYFPNAVTFICALKACGSIGASDKGKEIHDKILSLDILEKDILLGTTLVDMYAKCGTLCKAERVLEELPVQDVVTWSALITGYAQQGHSLEAIICFERMQSRGVKPDLIALSSVLSSCSHSGLLDQAETFFSGMSTKYGICPGLEHYCCMADIFGRAGKFNKALSMIGDMESDKCLPAWIALLGACRKWGELKFGILAFERALHLDKSNASIYALMADIYKAAGMHEEADKIEVMGVVNKAWKMPGCYWWAGTV